MNTLKIFSNYELRNVRVIDNNEKLVSIRKNCPDVKIKIAEYIEQNGGKKALLDAEYARESVVNMLNMAQSYLPSGFRLMIDSAYRSPETQRKSYESILNDMKLQNPSWTDEMIQREMNMQISPVDIAPHCAGAALDLTIIDEKGVRINMGTELDEFSEKTYTDSPLISSEAKENRSMLKAAMNKAGFVNFPAEWWHWSYGDREWALYKRKDAIYDIIER